MSNAVASPQAESLRRMIADELGELIAIRHDLHAHPELGYEEHRTCGVVQRELARIGIDHLAGLAGGTGVMAHIPGGEAGARAIGLRADMDALPILEKTGATYASTTPGVMHACGHDGHTTILLGAARVLARLSREQSLPRPVTFVFQPAEEGGAGGKRMVEDGCLTGNRLGPPIESMFGLHGWPQLPEGIVATRPGPLMAASDRFDITIKGTGSHAAWPHVSRDPVLAASAIVVAAQQFVARNVGPLDSAVLSITKINAGTAYNVIPESATIAGTVRTLAESTQTLAIARLREIAESTARAYGCTAELDYRIGYPATINDAGAVNTFFEVATATLGPDRVATLAQPVMGGEDFSYYAQHVPACFFVLGLIPPGRNSMPDLHQDNFDFNDSAIATGVEMFCRLVMGK